MSDHDRNRHRHDALDRESRADRDAVWDGLAVAAQGGDRTARDRLFSLLLPFVVGLAFRWVGNEADASDVGQEALLKLLANLGTFDPARGHIVALTARICHNEAVTWLRREQVRAAQALPCDRPVGGESDPARIVAGAEELEEFREALDDLPPAVKGVVRLRIAEGMTYKDAATALGIPAGTAATRMARGVAMLRRRLVA